METLFIAVVILALILLIVGWSSAINNTTCLWSVFHIFMGFLLIIEIIVCLIASNFSGFMRQIETEWVKSEDAEKHEIQSDLFCCGLNNITDRSVLPCPEGTTRGCLDVLQNVILTVRNSASIALFVCFTFGLFIDFVGCAICFHPDTINFEDHEKELALNDGRVLDVDAFENPFASENQVIDF
jgi:hypothetical protein